METDTKPINKTCSKCGEIKDKNLFKGLLYFPFFLYFKIVKI